ncbi:MAG: hypothetical protein IPN95_10560 [Bacteroidetes bacterium]|nr:hypothetical protein [Bacteroidota bacterium]
MRRWQLFFIGFLLNLGIRAQCPHNFSLQFEGEFRNPIFISALTMVADQLGRPYLYVASNEKGLNVLNVSGSNPFSVASLDTVALSMRVMSVTQRDSLLYVVVGSTFGGLTQPTDPPGPGDCGRERSATAVCAGHLDSSRFWNRCCDCAHRG